MDNNTVQMDTEKVKSKKKMIIIVALAIVCVVVIGYLIIPSSTPFDKLEWRSGMYETKSAIGNDGRISGNDLYYTDFPWVGEKGRLEIRFDGYGGLSYAKWDCESDNTLRSFRKIKMALDKKCGPGKFDKSSGKYTWYDKNTNDYEVSYNENHIYVYWNYHKYGY